MPERASQNLRVVVNWCNKASEGKAEVRLVIPDGVVVAGCNKIRFLVSHVLHIRT